MMSVLVANALLGPAAARLVLIHSLSRRWRLDPARYQRALQGWQMLDRELGLAAAGSMGLVSAVLDTANHEVAR